MKKKIDEKKSMQIIIPVFAITALLVNDAASSFFKAQYRIDHIYESDYIANLYFGVVSAISATSVATFTINNGTK